jgi:hypothetical protein
MSVVPLEDSAQVKKRNSASDQLNDSSYDTAYEEARRRGAGGRFTSQARPGVAERDARVKDKLNTAPPPAATKKNKDQKQHASKTPAPAANKHSAPAAPARDDKETPIIVTEVDVPLVWSFDAKNQKLDEHKLSEYLKQHGIEGDVSVLSAAGRQSDSTVHGPMALTIVGLEEKGKPVVKGRDKAGNAYTVIVPRNSKFYDGGGDKLYNRKNGDFDPADFADNMDVDVPKLRSDFTPYFGKGGQLAKTHIEVHKGNNEKLYELLTDSSGVESAFQGDSHDNPSIVVSRVDHKRVVDKYLTDGGYKRANRVRPEEVSFHLHHIGTPHSPMATANEDPWTPAIQLAGMTSAEKKEMSQPAASHRVTYEMRLQVAHKPKVDGDDDDTD